jgi:hypothetical protein
MSTRRGPVGLPALLLLAGCSGSGAGLDVNGRPLQSPDAPLVAEFSSIQRHVFTPICTECHAGAAAPLGLRLDEASAYAALVNAPSVESPGLKRVDPGNPAGSYMLHKIEGTASVGGRMPLGGPPLPQSTIDIIREWIQNGAAPPAAASTLGSATILTAVLPMQNEVLRSPPAAIVVAASAELDTTLLNGYSVSLVRSGGDGGFIQGNEVALTGLKIELRSISPTVFAVSPPPGQWVADRYRLVIAGSGAFAVRDRATLAIDGDGDGIPGGDYVLQFDVEGTP